MDHGKETNNNKNSKQWTLVGYWTNICYTFHLLFHSSESAAHSQFPRTLIVWKCETSELESNNGKFETDINFERLTPSTIPSYAHIHRRSLARHVTHWRNSWRDGQIGRKNKNGLFTSVFPRLATYFTAVPYFPALGIACTSFICFAAFGTSYTLLGVTRALIGLFQPIHGFIGWRSHRGLGQTQTCFQQ